MALLPAQTILSGFRSIRLLDFKSSGLPVISSLLSLLLLCFLVFIGLHGPRDPFSNGLTLAIWTLWWIGFLTIQALLGDLWRLINPWSGLYRLLIGHRHQNGLLSLPPIFGLWPGIVAFCLFATFMLADIAPDDPARLARLIMAYWVYTFVGMIVFGGETWLARGECFTVLLRYFSMVSTLTQSDGTLRAGTPGWQLVHPSRHTITGGIFVLIILAVGSFDGLNETFWWLGRLGINPLEFPGRSAVVFPTIVGLFGSIVIVTALFAATVALGNSIAGKPVPLGVAFGRFSLSVLPITVGYHIATTSRPFLSTGNTHWQPQPTPGRPALTILAWALSTSRPVFSAIMTRSKSSGSSRQALLLPGIFWRSASLMPWPLASTKTRERPRSARFLRPYSWLHTPFLDCGFLQLQEAPDSPGQRQTNKILWTNRLYANKLPTTPLEKTAQSKEGK